MKYFVLTTRGLEDVALQEINETIGKVKIISKEYRRIVFDYEDELKKLLNLRCVDDIFIFLKTFKVDHYRTSLKNLVHEIDKIDFKRIIKFLSGVRLFGKEITFAITVSNIGKKNYMPTEIKELLTSLFIKKYKWKLDNLNYQNMNIRIYIEHDFVLVGLRLGNHPLHRRGYKTETLPGSLKASVANCLLRIAKVKKDDIVLDPMCGVGTIPIEAVSFGSRVIAGDIDKHALQIAKKNSNNARANIEFYEGDARNLHLENKSVDKIVSNLPFDRQIKFKTDIKKFLEELFEECNRILKDDGKIFFLSIHKEIIENALSKSTKLKIADCKEISLFGLKPCVIEIQKI